MTSYAPISSTLGASKRPTIAVRSPPAEIRNAPVHALYVPAISSRHGSLVRSVSRTSVSQRSTSCSRRISAAWSSFSRTRFAWSTATPRTLPAVARLPFAAADFQLAARALERPVPPLHMRAAAQADLDDLADVAGELSGHAPTLGRGEDGYDEPSRRRGRVVRQRPAKPRTPVRFWSAPSALPGGSCRGEQLVFPFQTLEAVSPARVEGEPRGA